MMDLPFYFIGFYLMPLLAIIFCLNLVAIIKNVKNDQTTAPNTFWMTTSFVLIVWTIAILAIYSS